MCFIPILYLVLPLLTVGGMATRYGLDGPGIESRWGRDFPQPSRPTLGPTQPPVQWVPGLSRGVKRPGRVVDPQPHLQCRGLKKGRAIPLPTLMVLVAYKGRNFIFFTPTDRLGNVMNSYSSRSQSCNLQYGRKLTL